MVVVVVVSSTDEMLRDGIAEKNAEDLVLVGVGLVLVEGNEHQGVVHEVLVLKQRSEEALQELTGNGDGGVVTVRGHVGGCEESQIISRSWMK